ncbi:MAG: hypothetical protein GY838_13035 [bacterium]|nr:hypothetical protein [bacterium]
MMAKNWRVVRGERLRHVNCLVVLISALGRRFFAFGRETDFMDMDARGRLWWNQRWNDKRLYLHGPGTILRRGFTHGGTLRELVLALREYVLSGKQLWHGALGPWRNHPDAEGGRWGYGEEMENIRATARVLGILAEAKG